MLKPSVVVDAVVSTLQTISPLVGAMGGDPSRIVPYHFLYGGAHSLREAINVMLAPSILVVWAGTMGGNFDGMTIWKHHCDVYLRAPNVSNQTNPDLAFEDIWEMVMNDSVNGTALNIRQIQVLPGQLEIMDTPTITHMTDEEGQDYFCSKWIFPEIGDQS